MKIEQKETDCARISHEKLLLPFGVDIHRDATVVYTYNFTARDCRAFYSQWHRAHTKIMRLGVWCGAVGGHHEHFLNHSEFIYCRYTASIEDFPSIVSLCGRLYVLVSIGVVS